MEIKEILEKHLKWIKDENGGERADLSGANLSGADLSGADLYESNLSRANLSRADLSGANLSGADLSGANLSGADLSGANLYESDLSRASLSGANLSGAKNLNEIEELFISYTSICPEGSIIGWKKCRNNVIVKLEIPAEAKRSNAAGRKCRAEYAKVLEVIGSDVGISQHDCQTEYRVDETVYPDKWDENRWEECSSGIHFFISRAEADRY